MSPLLRPVLGVSLGVVIFFGGAVFRGTQVENQSTGSAVATAAAVLALFVLVVGLGAAGMWVHERRGQVSNLDDEADVREVD